MILAKLFAKIDKPRIECRFTARNMNQPCLSRGIESFFPLKRRAIGLDFCFLTPSDTKQYAQRKLHVVSNVQSASASYFIIFNEWLIFTDEQVQWENHTILNRDDPTPEWPGDLQKRDKAAKDGF